MTDNEGVLAEFEPVPSLPAPPRRLQVPPKVASEWAVIVRRMARRLARRLPRSVSLDDLVSAGNLGLARALTHYDPNAPGRFTAYAVKCVRGAMLDELRSMDPLTRQQRRWAGRIDEASRRLATTLGRTPSSEEVGAALELSGEVYERARGFTQNRVADVFDTVASIPAPGGVSALHDDPFGAEAILIRMQDALRMSDALEDMPQRLRDIISFYFGEGLTLREISELIGVTEPRVHQLRNQALRELRELCASVPPRRPPAAEARAK